jgi:hypothetical protein
MKMTSCTPATHEGRRRLMTKFSGVRRGGRQSVRVYCAAAAKSLARRRISFAVSTFVDRTSTRRAPPSDLTERSTGCPVIQNGSFGTTGSSGRPSSLRALWQFRTLSRPSVDRRGIGRSRIAAPLSWYSGPVRAALAIKYRGLTLTTERASKSSGG